MMIPLAVMPMQQTRPIRHRHRRRRARPHHRPPQPPPRARRSRLVSSVPLSSHASSLSRASPSVGHVHFHFHSPRPGRVRPTARGSWVSTYTRVRPTDRDRIEIETGDRGRVGSGLTLTSHRSSMRPGTHPPTRRIVPGGDRSEPIGIRSDSMDGCDATRAWTGASTRRDNARRDATRRVTTERKRKRPTDDAKERIDGTEKTIEQR